MQDKLVDLDSVQTF